MIMAMLRLPTTRSHSLLRMKIQVRCLTMNKEKFMGTIMITGIITTTTVIPTTIIKTDTLIKFLTNDKINAHFSGFSEFFIMPE